MTQEQLQDKKQVFKDPKLIKERMSEYFKKYTIPEIPKTTPIKNFGENEGNKKYADFMLPLNIP